MVVNNPGFRRLGCFNPWLVRLIIVSPLLPWVPSVRWSIGECWMSQVWFLSFSFFALGLGGEILAIGILDLWKVFLVALFFNAYLTFSRRGVGGGLFFPRFGRWKFSRRLSSSSGKCCMEELIHWIKFWVEGLWWLGCFVILCARGQQRMWSISCGALILLV